MPGLEPEFAGVRRVEEGRGREGGQEDVAHPRCHRRRRHATQPPVGHDLLRLWIGPDVGEQGGFLLQVIAAAGALGCGTNATYFFLLGSGGTRAISVISITTGVVTVAVAAATRNDSTWSTGIP